MSICVRQYIRQLTRNLRCCGAAKKRLLEQFRDKLAEFLEERPDPNRQALVEAFGPPEEMAQVLMETVSAEEKSQYRRQIVFTRIGVAFLIALLLAFFVYIGFLKEYRNIYIDDSVEVVDTLEDEQT